MKMLIPFMDDIKHSCEKQLAATALARMARWGFGEKIVEMNPEILKALIRGLNTRSACLAVRNLVQSSKKLAEEIIEKNALPSLCKCAEDFDVGCREAAINALAALASHSAEIAWKVVKHGVLTACIVPGLHEPELSLKHACALAIAEIGKHDADLAHALVDAGAICQLCRALESHDARLKKNALHALACVSQHGVELAETVVEAEVYPGALLLLKDADPSVRKCAMELVKETCKQSVELAQLMVSVGMIGAAISYLEQSPKDTNCIPAVLALGFVAAHSESLATNVIVARSIHIFGEILKSSADKKVQSTVLWALSQTGQHSAEHARAIAIAEGVFESIGECCQSKNEEMKDKAERCFKLILQKCTYLPALEPLLMNERLSLNLQVCILGQFARVLPSETKFRKSFVTSACLKRIQEFEFEVGSVGKDHVLTINQCFPPEIVKYYSPGYSNTLLDRIDNYKTPATETVEKVK